MITIPQCYELWLVRVRLDPELDDADFGFPKRVVAWQGPGYLCPVVVGRHTAGVEEDSSYYESRYFTDYDGALSHWKQWA